MIRILSPSVATSIQDQGRFGHRAEGFSRSGAMDPVSLAHLNELVGNEVSASGVEFGPGPMRFEVIEDGVIAFGGGRRDGAAWSKPIEVERGMEFSLSTTREGVWSYLAIAGGIDAPVVMGSRSTNVREGIGSWLKAGDVIAVLEKNVSRAPKAKGEPPRLNGPVRVFGELEGEFFVGTRVDRMGYRLEGTLLPPGPEDEWSEPVLPGCIQITPSGAPYVLMVEGSTVGGYQVAATVHSEDLRLVAQSRPGERIQFVQVGN